MDFKRLAKSFRFATRGTITVIKEEQNIKIYLLIALVNLVLGWFSHLNYTEWAIIVIAVSVTMGVEILNIALEELLDMISPEYNGRTKVIKDIAAGSALVTAIASIIVAILIYFPHWF
ncbi:MAG: diacylglycerol kinase family protein [Candidatus Berkelbacteria bacterium]|nr:diacylglycerol kinase family protein [Candidatus Berkelbacteria bacterium]